MDAIIEEKYIADYDFNLDLNGITRIKIQMMKSVCKIYKEEEKGSGFFCQFFYVKNGNKEIMNVLITNNHVLNEKDLNKEIMISLNNDNYSARINLANSRIKFTKEDLDVTIIELIKDDNIECSYLQIDASVNKEKNFLKNYYKKHPIYIINYKNGDIVYSSYGLLKGINENTNEIYHLCCTEKGSSGSPILSLKSNMVIGLHKGANKNYDFNVGILMKDIKDEFSKFLENLYKINNLKGSKLINSKIPNNSNYYINKDINNNYIKISNNQINNKNSNYLHYFNTVNKNNNAAKFSKQTKDNNKINFLSSNIINDFNYLNNSKNNNIMNNIRIKIGHKNIDNINRKTNNNKYKTVDKNKNIINNINNGRTNSIYFKGVNKYKNHYIDNKINNIESNNKIFKTVNKNNNIANNIESNNKILKTVNKNNNIVNNINNIKSNNNFKNVNKINKISIIKNKDKNNIIISEENKGLLKNYSIPNFEENDYEYISNLGEGSFGKIYLVRDKNTNEEYAIKNIFCRGKEELKECLKQIVILCKISHDNIIRVYKINISNNILQSFYLNILMEKGVYDWSEEIKQKRKKKNYYTQKELFSILKQLTSALYFLQEKNIAHRDIKPQNILIFPQNIYKITDLGEAKMNLNYKRDKTVVGSELFMSPLLYNGLKQNQNRINHNPFKSDVYSLGLCFLYAISLDINVIISLRGMKYDKNIKNIIEEKVEKAKNFPRIMNIIYRMIEYE